MCGLNTSLVLPPFIVAALLLAILKKGSQWLWVESQPFLWYFWQHTRADEKSQESMKQLPYQDAV